MTPERTNAPPRRKRKLTEKEKRRRARIRKKRQQMRRRRQMLQLATAAILILILILIGRGCTQKDTPKITSVSSENVTENTSSDKQSSNQMNHAKDNLEGTWEYDNSTVYYFDGRGNGYMTYPLVVFDFHYQVTGDHLHIHFSESVLQDCDYTCTIGNDILTLSGDNTMILHRKKD